mgnify:CR=1 FL=1
MFFPLHSRRIQSQHNLLEKELADHTIDILKYSNIRIVEKVIIFIMPRLFWFSFTHAFVKCWICSMRMIIAYRKEISGEKIYLCEGKREKGCMWNFPYRSQWKNIEQFSDSDISRCSFLSFSEWKVNFNWLISIEIIRFVDNLIEKIIASQSSVSLS